MQETSSHKNIHSVIIKNDMQLARSKVVEPVIAKLSAQGYCKQDQFAIRLGLEEALSNAYKHGNKCDPKKTISVKWLIDKDKTIIWVKDCGNGFDPQAVPDPRENGNIEKPSGRGLLLIRAYMSEVSFNEQGNEVKMVKKRGEKSES